MLLVNSITWTIMEIFLFPPLYMSFNSDISRNLHQVNAPSIQPYKIHGSLPTVLTSISVINNFNR